MLFINGSADKVGIGTSSPNQKLTVNGSISASDIIYASTFIGDGSQLIGIVAGAGTYLPLTGGQLTGGLTGTTAVFSDNLTADTFYLSNDTYIDEVAGGSYKRINFTVSGEDLVSFTKGLTYEVNFNVNKIDINNSLLVDGDKNITASSLSAVSITGTYAYFTSALSATTLSGDASALTAGNSDLLKGHPASYFATSDHTHPYLPLSGGTLDLNSGNDFKVDTSDISNAFFINKSSGKVGIGTSSPTYNLHVASAGVTRFLVQSTNNGQASFDL